MIWLGLLFCALSGRAQSPAESWQLQQLIVKSERQIELLKELLRESKQDAAALRRASQILQELSQGIHESLEKYQGTSAYAEALNRLQAKDDFANTYRDFQRLSQKNAVPSDDAVEFQIQSARANQQDVKRQAELAKLLAKAPPGMVAKIQAESQLGEWQAATRISVQLTELVASVRAMREELRSRNNDPPAILSEFMRGAELQNEKLRKRRQ